MSIGLLIDTREMGREATHKEDQGGQKHYIAKALDLERQVLIEFRNQSACQYAKSQNSSLSCTFVHRSP